MRPSLPPKALVLAPMAGIGHRAFRTLVEEFGGCDLYFTEMASVSALYSGAPFERYYIDPEPRPEKTVIQLVGSRQDYFVRAASHLRETPLFGLDINMGCSAPEIVRSGGGIVWMSDLEAARRLAGEVREAIPDKSLSVKLRTGWEDDPERLLAFCKGLEAEGIDFLTLHPRTKKEKLKRKAKWDYVALLAFELKIPVIGNGDIELPEDAERCMEASGAAGIMVGRAAARMPWIFALIRAREADPADMREIDLEGTARRLFELLRLYQPPEFWKTRAQRFIAHFSENLIFGNRLKMRAQTLGSLESIEAAVGRYFEECPEERRKIY